MKQVQENVQRDFNKKSEMCQEQEEFEDCDECDDVISMCFYLFLNQIGLNI